MLASRQINRLNYGIYFEKEGSIHFGKDMWLHTFQIKMPVKKGIDIIRKCEMKPYCKQMNELITQLNTFQKQNVEKFNQTIGVIKELFEDKTNPKGNHGSGKG